MRRATILAASVFLASSLWLTSAHEEQQQATFGQIPIVSGPLDLPTEFDHKPALDKGGYVPFFSGIATFAHLPYVQCWDVDTENYDILVVGAPYDIGVTFRTGARFGPSGIREGSRRLRGYNADTGVYTFKSWAKMADCGDIPFEPFSAEHAMKQIEDFTKHLLLRPTPPRLVTLGGDHTILLPILRSMRAAYNKPITVIHFDSHLDTWSPQVYNLKSKQSLINHGNPLYYASKEGLTANGTSIHVGIRSSLYRKEDYEADEALGFQIVKANDIFKLGVDGIVERIRDILGSPKDDHLVYLSIDIDVIDPSMAPATGTPESGGFLSREMRYILRGLEGYNLIGIDVVEVAPPYDNQAQLTSFLAADLIYEVLSLIVKRGESE